MLKKIRDDYLKSYEETYKNLGKYAKIIADILKKVLKTNVEWEIWNEVWISFIIKKYPFCQTPPEKPNNVCIEEIFDKVFGIMRTPEIHCQYQIPKEKAILLEKMLRKEEDKNE